VLKVFSGWLSDRLGQRKWLAVGGYALSAFSKPFLFFANSWEWVLGVRFGDRLGKGLRTAPRDALVADSIDEKQRGLAFGLHRAGDTAGAVVGLLIAFGVVWFVQRADLRLERSTFRTLVLFSLVPAVLAVIGLALGAQETRIPAERRAARAPSFSLAAFDARFRLFLFVVVLFTLGNSSDAFLILRAQAAGLPVLGVLGMMITFNAVYTLVSGPAGALSDRVGRRRLIVGGWAVYGLIYLGFARVTAGWQAWALMAVYGIYYGLTEGVAKALVADLVPAEKRGTAYGLFNAAIGLTAFPASFIAGVLWQGAFGWNGFGPGAPFYFGAVMALLACALMLFALPERATTRVTPTGQSPG
jgi:MFS family permease